MSRRPSRDRPTGEGGDKPKRKRKRRRKKKPAGTDAPGAEGAPAEATLPHS